VPIKHELLWKRSATKELQAFEGVVKQRILSAVESLAEDPLPHGVRKLKGSRYTYRIRVGEYRAVYSIDSDRKVVTVLAVRHRSDAYK
jgi:mRNA interferase RelE/StbE